MKPRRVPRGDGEPVDTNEVKDNSKFKGNLLAMSRVTMELAVNRRLKDKTLAESLKEEAIALVNGTDKGRNLSVILDCRLITDEKEGHYYFVTKIYKAVDTKEEAR